MVQDKYSEYLDSELMWVREYPAHWSLTKVKYEAYVKARVGWHGLKTDDFTDVGPYLVTGSDFKSSVISWKDCYHCDLARYEQDPYIQLQNGDLLLTKDGTIGKIALVQGLGVDEKATLNSGVFVVRPLSNGFTTEFYFWLLESTVFKKFFDYFKTGSTIVHLYQDTFVNFSYASPPLIEQTQIAKFLDHETAQIDTLIEKQQTLIQLLKEKRQAVISHAVTKGLNPDAPMKDSGVEWLGEVPEHWEVKRIKHYGKIMGGFAFKSDDFIDSGYPVLKISNVSHLQLNFDDESFLPLSFVEKHLEYKVEENDLVFAMTRPIISGGIKVAKIPKLEAMPYS
nr:restriction endonuclease subunit S [Psychrobacter sp. 1044]